MKAFIFDLNGTMVHDMEYHTRAWHELLNHDLKGGFTWEQVKANMYGKNQEVFVRLFGPDRFSAEEIQRLSLLKEQRYQQAFRPHLRLVPGLTAFLHQAHARQIPMAISSAAIPFNISFVLDNLNLRPYFRAIVSADDVVHGKPHPEAFLKAAAALAVPPADCIVFEDVPKGAEAAHNAGMKAVVLTTTHPPAGFAALPNILAFVPDFTAPAVQALL